MNTDLKIDDHHLQANPMPCERCAHARQDRSTRFFQLTCPGFPDGIPAAIVRGEVDHTQPVEGDHGYLFRALE